MKKTLIAVFIVLLIDQLVKFLVKTTMQLGEEIPLIGDWAVIHFTENPGMAFGVEIDGNGEKGWGKLALSFFRIIVIIAGFVWMYRMSKKPSTSPLLLTTIGLILGGAIGNLVDCIAYGLIFDHSEGQIATFMPTHGGYGEFLRGKVVDMFYFPITTIHFPEWLPFLGGTDYLFFDGIFNVADAAITVGMAILLVFQKRFFPE